MSPDKTIQRILELSADAQIARRRAAKNSPAFHTLTGAIAAYGQVLTLLVAPHLGGKNSPQRIDQRGYQADIRGYTAEHASDIAEAAMNETMSEVTVKLCTDKRFGLS